MRLIDADSLETHEQLEPFGNGNYEIVEVVYKDDIDNALTFEPERKKGKWILVDGYRCSKCNYKLQSTGMPMYCPNCGASMSR